MKNREMGTPLIDSFQTFILPGEKDSVPASYGGLYQFCLRFPSDYEVGFHQTPVEADRICKVVLNYLARAMPIIGLGSLSGAISTDHQGHYLRTSYHVSCNRSDIELTQKLLKELMASCGGSSLNFSTWKCVGMLLIVLTIGGASPSSTEE